ncbi:MAG TPA: flavin reductase family protein [Burkholderiales bacterium]|nr:flavin reductase family protein [Burkholderiales bacterium]
MDWNFDSLPVEQRYKLLVGLVIPRPIALITSLGPEGIVNAAPFSFFNVLGDEPPICIVSIEHRDDGTLKDTARNIEASGEFVVNLVDEAIAEQMHVCSLEYPRETSEMDVAGFHAAPSRAVRPPRIAEAPVSLECTTHTRIDMDTRLLVIGRIHWLHAHEDLVEPDTLRVRLENYHPIGRLFANRYTRTREQFAADANAFNERQKARGRI